MRVLFLALKTDIQATFVCIVKVAPTQHFIKKDFECVHNIGQFHAVVSLVL